MKKLTALVFLALLCAGTLSASGGRAILNLYGSALNVAQNKFTGQKGGNKIFFEVKAAYAISGNLYLWASHGYFPLRDSWSSWESKGSFAPDALVERTLGKRIVAGGGGVFIGYFEPGQIAVRAEAGVCHIANDIDTAVSSLATGQFIRGVEDKQRGIGARGGLAVTYGLYRSVFAEASAGYMYAADKIDGVRSNLGGFHVALGLGIQL